jgi:hypothetical protein
MDTHRFATNERTGAPVRDYAAEFRDRKHADPWWYFLACLALFLVIGAFFIFFCGVRATQYFAAVIIPFAVVSYAGWRRPRPICPNCKRNIQWCRAVHCHVCGQPMTHARCERCDVLQNWTHIFASKADTSGNRHRITYCPSCGVLLRTDFLRALGGGES